jgi:AraC-like DNA-binding protein
MRGVGTAILTAPDDYEVSFRGAKIILVPTGHGSFKARLTCMELPNLHLFSCQEILARIAYISLAPQRFFISLPMSFDPPPIWCGIELRSGDIVLHSIGERMHQRTNGASRWAFMSLSPNILAKFGKSLIGDDLIPPSVGRVMRPAAGAVAHLRRQCARACRVAESKPDRIAHGEAARALEEDLLHAIVNCMTPTDTHEHGAKLQYHMSIMASFEELLATHVGRQLRLSEICTALGVPERTLRVCCAEILGMGPSQYARLRRLNLVRSALRRHRAAGTTIAQIAGQYGFSEFGRFAVAYRLAFGEKPSATLRRFGS